MKTTLLALLVYISMIGTAGAEAVAFQGLGIASCTKFEQDLKASPQASTNVYYAWAQGFMNGLNTTGFLDQDQTRDLMSAAVPDQMKTLTLYCDAHPDSTFGTSVVELYKTLKIVPPAGR